LGFPISKILFLIFSGFRIFRNPLFTIITFLNLNRVNVRLHRFNPLPSFLRMFGSNVTNLALRVYRKMTAGTSICPKCRACVFMASHISLTPCSFDFHKYSDVSCCGVKRTPITPLKRVIALERKKCRHLIRHPLKNPAKTFLLTTEASASAPLALSCLCPRCY